MTDNEGIRTASLEEIDSVIAEDLILADLTAENIYSNNDETKTVTDDESDGNDDHSRNNIVSYVESIIGNGIIEGENQEGGQEGGREENTYSESNPSCTHDACKLENYSTLRKSFSDLNTHDRVCVVRNMLFATTSRRGKSNSLHGKKLQNISEVRKRKRNENRGDVESRTKPVYCVLGQNICRTAFSELVCLDDKTVERHANQVANNGGFINYNSKQSKSRSGKLGLQRLAVSGFLNYFTSCHGIECPSGRGSKHNQPRLIVSNTWTKVDAYDEYKKAWRGILDAVLELIPSKKNNAPSSPISYSLFLRYWSEDFSFLRIGRCGSDFCDQCITLKEDLKITPSHDIRFHPLQQALALHRYDAKTEFLFYKTIQHNCNGKPNGDQRHFVFDFSEKILLPKLQNQPGPLHFTMGLKFDIFGVSSSNERVNYIFGLPEGHWPTEKTANVVISMLHHLLHMQIINRRPGYQAKNLLLHADNCTGQNKNRYIIWYMCWRVLVGLDDTIELLFLVAGHTKNICDGAFGHVKRLLKNRDITTPLQMMDLIDESSTTTTCIPSADVKWRDWKKILSNLFIIPSAFHLSKYHVFSFRNSCWDSVYVKKMSASIEEDVYKLVLVSNSNIQSIDWNSLIDQEQFILKWKPLEDVPSEHYKNRKNYLTEKILDRYYTNNDSIRKEYFLNGVRGP